MINEVETSPNDRFITNGISYNIGNPTINLPFGDGWKTTIYGDAAHGLLLSLPHETNFANYRAPPDIEESEVVSTLQALHAARSEKTHMVNISKNGQPTMSAC